MKSRIIALFLLFVILLTSGFGCKVESAQVKEAMKPVIINYWRVWDDEDAFDAIIKRYNLVHPNIKIQYRKFRYEEYEKELLNAMAEDRGPDIFSIPASWIGRYKTKIAPMPESTTLAYPEVVGTLKKETITTVKTNKSLSLKDLKNNFVDVVYSDVVVKEKDLTTKQLKEKVYGLPMSVDTLALYYNKDLFNNAGISVMPEYWNKTFQQYVQKLSKQNTQGDIIQSGMAFGSSNNIERVADILSVLMMQNGAIMTSDTGNEIKFNQKMPGEDNDYYPGVEAIRFFVDFSNPAKEVYSWNDKLDNSMKLFAGNKLAMMLGYAYQLPTIKAEAPKLNFGIAKLPQIENAAQNTNYANYWVETVSKKSTFQNEAWDFVQYITKAEQAKEYLKKTKKPTALKALVAEQLDDMEVGVFASQVLTAKSWYHGKDAQAVDQILAEMITQAKADPDKLPMAVTQAAQKVQQTLE
ncbi:MAG: extracellular solute-binding protein [bacterium]